MFAEVGPLVLDPKIDIKVSELMSKEQALFNNVTLDKFKDLSVFTDQSSIKLPLKCQINMNYEKISFYSQSNQEQAFMDSKLTLLDMIIIKHVNNKVEIKKEGEFLGYMTL